MVNVSDSDTIAAVSTPIGRGGIGIVRLSGEKSLSIADQIFFSKDGAKPSFFKSYSLHYGWVVNPAKPKARRAIPLVRPESSNVIDEVLLIVMRAPKSYTREDIVEISCHSGIAVLRKILDVVLSSGARLAEPGEFTKRAFLNGRIDLSRAEAVLDVINAKTGLALQHGIKNLQGSLSAEVSSIRNGLLEAIVPIEASIDFPEEGIAGVCGKKMRRDISRASKAIKVLLSSAEHGKILREGISAVIVGKANVGKSSLLNALLKEERAIVTPVAGTTRDVIEETLDLSGIPLKIADTAGIIEPGDVVEQEAVKRTQSYFDKAGLILLVFDLSRKLDLQDRLLIEMAKGKIVIVVLNKSDLSQKIELDEIRKHFPDFVKVSSLKYRGIKGLEKKIVKLVWEGKLEGDGEIAVSNPRHIQVLRKALEALMAAKGSLEGGLPYEFIVEDLKACGRSLAQITGESIEEGLLERIFNEFCVGK